MTPDAIVHQPLTSDERDRLASATPEQCVRVFKELLAQATGRLSEAFDAAVPVGALANARSHLIDELLIQAWQHFGPHDAQAALIAVGGYGREELMPASDIDLLMLVAPEAVATTAESLSAFLTFLWDIRLEVGHAVRTPAECQTQARADVTVITNLIEARLITGSASLFAEMQQAIAPERIWPSEAFFDAKCHEQRARWQKYGDTAYNLEPNIKENPGGLRDIQMIAWVTKRHFGTTAFEELVRHGFLTQTEYFTLIESQALLWRIRFALHRLAGRREDRLLFDYQRTLAAEFGFSDTEADLAVEQFMQQYYRAVMELNRLNEMLLQLFREAIVLHDHIGPPQPINKRFQSRSGYLEVTHDQVFNRSPFALLELFHILQLHPELKGVRASTIRQVRESRHRIDDVFREDLRARSLFMEIFRHPTGLSRVLTRMNRYGVLAHYIPAFANIVGRMQYDLFHVYTVDEHTLMLVRNLRRFSVSQHDHEFPLCSAIARRIPKRELLYLGGLFHDVAKGRGGDHSQLGARDAWDFCQLHHLSEYDSRLVVWLVETHLLMSLTAQRKDIRDSDVIQEFATLVGDVNRLNYLYLLTVADSRATNPKRWNSWKDALLRELYLSTRNALERGLDNPQAQDDLIEQKQTEAMRILARAGVEAEQCRDLWHKLSADFFAPAAPEEIAWQTEQILASERLGLPLVAIRSLAPRGCSEIFIHARDGKNLFVRTTALLDQLGLNIVDARITTTDDGGAMNSFQVLGADGLPVPQGEETDELCALLHRELEQLDNDKFEVARRLPRQHHHFPIETRVSFNDDPKRQRTMMRLVTLDRPGLLAEVGSVFASCDIRLQSAKIATVGAEVDDVFFITTLADEPIRCETVLACLRQEIHRRLEKSPARA
ncbi:[protein-PII] uridylyltransferase [Thiorhodovibrio frisius]|uniref:Bifunctional uridylyltransferase/uridylyl-removing enzyme n=1 Tax=Thiorhodovibrio frisius TaxID=631362 RepID=H8Z800_9GAMM|nr:[protein-PII] uridylyltransferase [Thiorhodovibrio frisius]EIC19935.1 (protein-PII) uridylyltransferase [Thiorhodovibrio frisius]WPL20664.1 PII uridylyl-transferase [Thiorhodovibrio frisius]